MNFYQCGRTASYASAGIAGAEMSVCPSVRPSHSSIASKRTRLASWFLHRRRGRVLKMTVHHKIRKG